MREEARRLRPPLCDMLGCDAPVPVAAMGEPDLRPMMAVLNADGVTIALLLVETKAAPLPVRHQTPESQMVRGDWNIPVPPPDAPEATPDITLAPLVGRTQEGFRLGYGGGCFDRTLAALDPRRFAIGIGFDATRLDTIYPQPRGIALDLILTEAGIIQPSACA